MGHTVYRILIKGRHVPCAVVDNTVYVHLKLLGVMFKTHLTTVAPMVITKLDLDGYGGGVNMIKMGLALIILQNVDCPTCESVNLKMERHGIAEAWDAYIKGLPDVPLGKFDHANLNWFNDMAASGPFVERYPPMEQLPTCLLKHYTNRRKQQSTWAAPRIYCSPSSILSSEIGMDILAQFSAELTQRCQMNQITDNCDQ